MCGTTVKCLHVLVNSLESTNFISLCQYLRVRRTYGKLDVKWLRVRCGELPAGKAAGWASLDGVGPPAEQVAW